LTFGTTEALPDQDEPGDVLADRALGLFVAHDLPRPPCRPEEPGRLLSRQHALARSAFFRQCDLHDLAAIAF
jgi:hypothetical protein